MHAMPPDTVATVVSASPEPGIPFCTRLDCVILREPGGEQPARYYRAVVSFGRAGNPPDVQVGDGVWVDSACPDIMQWITDPRGLSTALWLVGDVWRVSE